MNPTEQRNHKRVTEEIVSSVDTFAAVTVARFESVDVECQRVREMVGDERTHRLMMADEQRAYVDAEDARLRREFTSFYNRTFMKRLRWLFRGK